MSQCVTYLLPHAPIMHIFFFLPTVCIMRYSTVASTVPGLTYDIRLSKLILHYPHDLQVTRVTCRIYLGLTRTHYYLTRVGYGRCRGPRPIGAFCVLLHASQAPSFGERGSSLALTVLQAEKSSFAQILFIFLLASPYTLVSIPSVVTGGPGLACVGTTACLPVRWQGPGGGGSSRVVAFFRATTTPRCWLSPSSSGLLHRPRPLLHSHIAPVPQFGFCSPTVQNP